MCRATREAQESWSGQPIPSPADLPDPGIEPGSSALQVYSLLAELPGKPWYQQVQLTDKKMFFYFHHAVVPYISKSKQILIFRVYSYFPGSHKGFFFLIFIFTIRCVNQNPKEILYLVQLLGYLPLSVYFFPPGILFIFLKFILIGG